MLNTTTCPIGFLAALPASLNISAVGLDIAAVEQDLQRSLASSVTLALALLAASSLVLFWGARLVKPTLFLAAFGVTFLLGLFVARAFLSANLDFSATTSCIFLGAAPLTMGLVGGLAALCLMQVGFALLGAAAGSGLGYMAYAAGLGSLPIPDGIPDLYLYLCLGFGALIGACLLLKFEDKLLILTTSAVGAAGATPAIALLLSHINVRFVSDVGDFKSPFGWSELGCAALLFAGGLTFQCRAERKKKAREVVVMIPGNSGIRASQVPLMQP